MKVVQYCQVPFFKVLKQSCSFKMTEIMTNVSNRKGALTLLASGFVSLSCLWLLWSVTWPEDNMWRNEHWHTGQFACSSFEKVQLCLPKCILVRFWNLIWTLEISNVFFASSVRCIWIVLFSHSAKASVIGILFWRVFSFIPHFCSVEHIHRVTPISTLSGKPPPKAASSTKHL